MRRNEWVFHVEIVVKGRDKDAAIARAGKLLNRKMVLRYRIKNLIRSYNGGIYPCPESVTKMAVLPNQNLPAE
jgi:hypothetical protein